MKCNQYIAIITVLFLIVVSGLATADVLPKQRPENQKFAITSVVDLVGPSGGDLSAVWQVGDTGLEAVPNVVGAGGEAVRSGSIAYATYSDFILSNGGQISQVKSFSMDTHAKDAGLYNIETAKILTYTSQNGSHLMGEESYVLDVAGNWSRTFGDDVICVFSKLGERRIIPAFCNKVTALSKLRSINTAQVESIGSLTAVGSKPTVPAALNYEISVTPDTNSASGYADGIISTAFTISIMEGRSDGNLRYKPGDPNIPLYPQGSPSVPSYGIPYFPRGPDAYINLEYYDELASTLTHIDTALVSGGISNFNKAFNYQSGIACCE
jgi:hypothetical protein